MNRTILWGILLGVCVSFLSISFMGAGRSVPTVFAEPSKITAPCQKPLDEYLVVAEILLNAGERYHVATVLNSTQQALGYIALYNACSARGK